MPSCRTAVLRPRCWSGRNRTFSPRANAHSMTFLALEEVQTTPPSRPQKALMSAEEFMYVTGTVTSATPASASTSQQSSTWASRAMSAIEQPAARSGRITCCVGAGEDVGRLGHEVDAAEDDELGLGPGRRLAGELERVAGDVGELDDLVALVVVAEHEDPLAQLRLRAPGAFDQGRVGGRGQLAGALDAALRARVRPLPQHEERQRRTGRWRWASSSRPQFYL